MALASEVKNLSNAARQLEPYVVALSAADIAIAQMHQQVQNVQSQQQIIHPKPSAEEAAHLQSVLEHINLLHQAELVKTLMRVRWVLTVYGEIILYLLITIFACFLRRLRKEPETGKGECRVHSGTSPGHASTSSTQDKLLYIKCKPRIC